MGTQKGTQGGVQTSSPSVTKTKELDSLEISGTVKWFNLSKQYGFIVPNNGLPDVLIGVNCLRAAGCQTLLEGTSIVVDVVKNVNGYNATRILSLNESTAIQPSLTTSRKLVKVVAESGWETCQVKVYDRLKGYGFLISGKSAQDIFVHAETLRVFGFIELRRGQEVQVRWGRRPKGLMVAEIRTTRLSQLL